MQTINLFLILLLSVNAVYASDFDEPLADTLKIEANHNLERLKSYRKEVANNKIFENEREKGLSEHLEEQDKWELIRERGLRDYLKQKRTATLDETSQEYQTDLKEKKTALQQYEKSRNTHVRTRDKIKSQIPQNLTNLEVEELQLVTERPRFDVRKKGQYKWAAKGAGAISRPSPAVSQPVFQDNFQPPVVDNFAPADFPPAPAPYEGFEDIQQSPIYDGNLNNSIPYDPSFGGEMSIPPPPPPPPDYNF